MHGVKRVKQSEEIIAARKQKEQAKIKEYLALEDNILARKKQNDWSQEVFDHTTRMLQINPEYYSVWNYRRNILTNGLFPQRSHQEVNDLLTDDLSMTTAALKSHPKVYWIWNHRRWCLEQVPDGPEEEPDGWRKANWNKEMYFVEKMLDADPRNFHAWAYRRYVLAGMPVRRSEESELAYTTRKIEANFSNFSAWHQRSKVLQSLWDQGKLEKEKSLEIEFDLAHNAMFTDPNDQSLWIYHRWLVGSGEDTNVLEREIILIQELLDEQPDSKWCMDSLVYYKRLLLRSAGGVGPAERLALECVQLLHSLRRIDPGRRRRYEEIEQEIQGYTN